MEEPKKPTLVQRLLSGTRRRSASVTQPLKRESEIADGKTLASAPSAPTPAPPSLRGRSGTAGGLLSRSSSKAIDPVDKDELYEKNPTCVEQLPKVLQSLYLMDSLLTDREAMNKHFELTLRVLRLTVKKEHRHYSFFRPKGASGVSGKDEDAMEPVKSVFCEVPKEKAVRKRYKVGEEIGKGAFGCVYQGKYEGKAVALKKISNMGERSSARNRQEAFYLSKCQHDKILRVYDCLHALDTNTVWLVMELIQGGSLDEALHLSGPLPEKEAASVCKDLLLALKYLHERGFAHRDVKPANAMLALEELKRASVKLVDFSLCHDTSLQLLVHAVGTVMFMPPEMIAKEAHDVLTDVWSLGITAVYLLRGKGPFKNSFDALFLPASGIAMPTIGSEFSASACKFVCDACTPKSARPSATELLNHEWIAGAAQPDQMWRLVKSVFRHSSINNVIGGF